MFTDKFLSLVWLKTIQNDQEILNFDMFFIVQILHTDSEHKLLLFFFFLQQNYKFIFVFFL